MKVQAKISSKLIMEIEADTQSAMFEELAKIQDVFGQDKCGKPECKSDRVKFVVRTDKDDNKYYSMDCLDCRARLQFGSHKKGGGLFVRRKDKEDKWITDGGWQKWNTKTQTME